jgi:hypothetical protein
MGALGQVTGSSSAAFAAATNAAGGLAQAFAAGGPMALGIAAATIAVGQLSDAIGRYIEKSSLAETKGFTESMGKIASGSSISRALADRTAGLKEELGITTKLEKLQREKAALDAQEQQLQSMATTKVRTEDEITALVGYKKSLRDVREQRFLITQAIEQETIAQQKAIDAQETALAAAEKQKQAAEALLRLERARAGLAAANAASSVEAEDKALGLDNPDPGAGLFGSQAPVATAEQIKAMNELFMMAPSAGPGAGVIDGAVDAIEELTRASREAADALQASLVAGLQASAMSLLTSAASGNLRGVGAAAGAGLGAVAGANIAQGVAGVDPAMAQQVGGALGGLLGGALGDVATSLMDAIAQVGEKMGALAPIVDASGLVVAQLEPLWGTVADLGLVLADALLYLSPIVRLVAEAMNFVIAPLGGMAEMLHDVMQDGLVPFAIGMSTAINGIIDAINTVIRWANTTFGTDLGELGHVIVADLIAPVEDAGEAIRENLTDEFVNLPPGFKTGGAVFAATDVGGAGGGSGGLTIGTVNVSTTRTLLDELKSLQDRAGVGSSSIIGGRNSISDRRN